MARRTGSAVIAPLLGLLAFLSSLALGAILHLNLPPTRQAARSLAVAGFNGFFSGTVQLDEVQRLSAGGIALEGLTFKDPAGRTVLHVNAFEADFDLAGILLRLLSQQEKVSLMIDEATIRGPTVGLHQTELPGSGRADGLSLSIATVFRPRTTSPTPSEGRPLRLWFPRIRVLHLEGHGEPVVGHPVFVRIPGLVTSLLVTDRGVALDIEKFGLRATGLAPKDVLAIGQLKIRAPGSVSGEIRGQLGDVPVHQVFDFSAGNLRVDGEFPRLAATELRPLVPAWPIDGDLAIKNHIEGTLPRLRAELEVLTPAGEVRASGLLTVAPELEADLDVDAEHLDLSKLRHDLPQSSLNLRSSLEIWLSGDRPNLELNATLLESSLKGEALPIVDLGANYDERGLIAKATLHERGIPLHIDVEGTPPTSLDFTATLRQTELSEAPRLRQLTQASGFVEGQVKGRLTPDLLEGVVSLSATNIEVAGVRGERATLRGDVSVPLPHAEKVRGELRLDVLRFETGGLHLPELRVAARGRLLLPQLSVDAQTERHAAVHLEGQADLRSQSLDNVRGAIEGLDQPVRLRIGHLHARSDEVVVQQLHLAGEGSADLDLALRPSGYEVQLHARRLNLARMLEAAGMQALGLSGSLDSDADFRLARDSRGTIRVAVHGGAYANVSGVQFELNTELDGATSRGSLSAAIEDGLRLDSIWDVTVPDSWLAFGRFREATGQASVTVSDSDIEWLMDRFLGGANPDWRASGQLLAQIDVSRAHAAEVPAVTAHVQTHGLAVSRALASSGDLSTEPPVEISGIDVDARAALNRERSRIEAAVRLTDGHGDLVAATGSAELPLSAWLEQTPSKNDAIETLERAPLDAVLLLNERELAQLPTFAQPQGLDGILAARAILHGTWADPKVDLTATGRELSGPALGLTSAVAAQGSVLVRPRAGRLTGTITADQAKQRIGTLSFDVVVPSLAGQIPAPGEPLWTGALEAFFEGAPLDLLTALHEQQVRGRVQGSVAVKRLSRQPSMSADLSLRSLQVGEQRLGAGAISLTTSADRLSAKAQFDDEYGRLDVNAEVALTETPALAEIDFAQPLRITLRANDYDAAVLTPLTAGTLTELRGSLLGSLELEVSPPPAQDGEWVTSFGGHVNLTDGTLTPAAMGLRLDSVNLALVAAREGDSNVVRLEGFRARARSNEENLRGSGVAYFHNLALERATFELLPERFPAMSGGTKVADVSGKVRGAIRTNDRETTIDLSLAGLEVELTSEQDKSLIDLTDNETIDIVERPRKQDAAAEQRRRQQPLVLNVDLGSGVRLKNRMLNLVLQGAPQVTLEGTTQVTGDVELVKGGRVQVLGKIFVIDYGRVMFNPSDSTNPHLDIATGWRASSGVTVRANISGTLNSPILEWGSEPPLPGGEAEIIALVLGGGSNSQDGTNANVGVTYLAAQMNQALGETGVRGVDFYAGSESDTSEGQVARLSDHRSWNSYTASVQVSDQVWFEGSYRRETSTVTATQRDGLSGTVDWRFAPNWSARTEVGQLGVGLDMQWQYRY